MKSRINKILQDIEKKKLELKKAYGDLMKKYDFSLVRGKITFSKDTISKNKRFKLSFPKALLSPNFRHLISMPFIYVMVIPVGILDIFLFLYQQTCFRLYRIPLVKRKDYVVFDRHLLFYLNRLEKLNCLYCSYANGIFSYAREIAGRTEKYRCPVKHAKRQSGGHLWEDKFADYGDAEGFREVFNNAECFYKLDDGNT